MTPPTEQARIPVFIFLSDEALELVNENGLDLVHELRKQGQDVQPCQLADPAAQVGTKDVALVILAVAVAAPLVGAGIARVIDAIGRNKRFVVTDRRCVLARDENGNPIRRPDGQPVMNWEETPKLLEPKQTSDQSLRVKAEYMGFEVTVSEGATPERSSKV